MVPDDRSFKHSGKLGDIIYALPAMRALGGGILDLAPSDELGFPLSAIQVLVPLLRDQPYIRGIKIWSGKKPEFDFDTVRQRPLERFNLASAYLTLFGMPDDEKDRAWLDVPKNPSAPIGKVVLSRSLRHPGIPGFWNAVMRRWGTDAVFVGTKEEHSVFASEFGEVPYQPSNDLLELAQQIQAASLFIGNQSAPYAVAEGLKVATIQECDDSSPNCVFERPNAFYVSNSRHLKQLESGKDLKGNSTEVALANRPKVQIGPHAGGLGPATKTGVSVIVLTYNSIDTIGKCLASLRPTLNEDDELILIDNASTDGTAAFLSGQAEITGTVVILNDTNRGFSAANNQGILVSKGEVIVLLNPDTEVQPGWLQAMRGRFQDLRVGAVGPVANNGLASQFVRFHLPQGYAGSNLVSELAHAIRITHPGRSMETKLLVGFCLMLRRDVLDQVGLLDESMFLGSEDMELSWRLREFGYLLLIARDVLVAHNFGTSFSSLESEMKAKYLEESTRALVSRIRKAYDPVLPPTSTEIWGIDIVPDSMMLMDLKTPKMKKLKKNAATEVDFPEEAKAAAKDPGFHEIWVEDDCLVALEALAHKVKPLTGAVIDIGCWEGLTTSILANASLPDEVIAIDTWEGNICESPDHATVQILKVRDVKSAFETNMAAMTKGNIKVCQKDACQFLSKQTGVIRLCHIDASNDYATVKSIILAAKPQLARGGVLCGQNFRSAHMGRADLAGGVQRAVSETLPGFFHRGNLWYWVNGAVK